MGNQFKIGKWIVDPDRNQLISDRETISIEQKVMEVLLHLAHNNRQVISRETLIEGVWPDNYVTEESLTRCISLLRKALDDDPADPVYIKTVKGKGYELIAPVRTYDESVNRPDKKSSILSKFFSSAWYPAAALILVFLILGLLPNYLVKSGGDENLSYWKKQPLTTQIGQEIHPAMAPDGSRIAYAAYDDFERNWNIYVQVIGAGEPLRLTKDLSNDLAPEWSPDGRYVAFVRQEKGGSAIYSIPALGGSESRIISRNIDDLAHLSWSSNGNQIAYSDRAAPDQSNVIYQVEVKTGKVVQLTRANSQHWGDFAPSYSPDGRYLTYIASVSAGTKAVFRLNLQDGTRKAVTPMPMHITGQTWSLDGASIYFVTDLPEAHSIWVADAGFQQAPQWTGITGTNPSAKSGGQMLIEQNRAEMNLVEIRLNQSENEDSLSPVRSVNFNSSGSDYAPVLSSDGSWIAFISDRSGHDELWVYEYASGTLKQLTSFEGTRYLQSPSWAADNQTIAFNTFTPKSHADIWIAHISGTPPKPLEKRPHPSNEVAPYWCQDGRSILAGSNRTGRWQIWKYNIMQKRWEQVTENGGYAARCNADGSAIYFTKYDQPGIWKYLIDDSSEERIINDFSGLLPYNWHLVDDGIYYKPGGTQEFSGILFFSFEDDQSSSVLVPEKGELFHGFTLSPVSGKMVSSVIKNRESGIYLYKRNDDKLPFQSGFK